MILLWAVMIFGSGLALHLIWWQIQIPKRQSKTLFILFFSVMAAGLAAGLAMPDGCELALRGWQAARAGLCAASMALAYIITYSAVEADSPTLVIALAIRAAGGAGLSPEEIFAGFDDGRLIAPRLGDLVSDKLAVIENGRYRITRRGRLLAGIFTAYRALIGAGKGG
ncbi:MAG: hypothetical protein WC421_01310 [Elusimicrobiales bacterium]